MPVLRTGSRSKALSRVKSKPTKVAIPILEGIVRNSPDPMLLLDLNGVVMCLNAWAVKLLDISARTAIGKNWREIEFLSIFLDPAALTAAAKSAQKSNPPKQQRYVFNLGKKHYEYILIPVELPVPANQGVLCIFRDISPSIQSSLKSEVQSRKQSRDELEKIVKKRTRELLKANDRLLDEVSLRQQTNEALANTGNQLKIMMENSSDVIFTISLEGKITELNPAFEAETGWEMKKWLGRSFRDILHPEDVEKAYQKMGALQRGDNNGLLELRIKCKNGKYVTLEISGQVINLDGVITGIWGIGRDITSRVEYQHQLENLSQRVRHQAEMLDEILASSLDMVLLFDLEGNILFANKSVASIIKPGYEELAQKTWKHLLIQPKDTEMLSSAFRKVISTGKSSSGEMSNCRNGKTFEYEYIFSPLHGKQGSVAAVVATIRDITQRKRMQARLFRINQCFVNLGKNPNANIKVLVKEAGELLGASSVMYNRVMDGHVEVRASWNLPEGYPVKEKTDGNICYELMSRKLETVLVINQLHKSHYSRVNPNINKFGLKTYIGKGIKFGNNIIGTLCLVYKDDYYPDEEDKKIVYLLSMAIGVEEERLKSINALREMTLSDELTGLYNRRGFLALAEQQIRIAKRKKQDLMLLFADLDNMKWINDQLGHKEGDQALQDVAKILHQSFRDSDIIARYGGDEFVVLAIESSEITMETLLTRLDKNLQAANTNPLRKYRLSLSKGITTYKSGVTKNIAQMLEIADKLMYEDKRQKTTYAK